MKRIAAIFILFFSFLIKAQPPTAFYTKFGGAGVDIGYGVKQTFDKQYVIAGSTTSFGVGNADVYLVLLDSMGNVKWSKTFGGAMSDVAKSIIINPVDSGFVLAGYTSSFGNGGYDFYVLRTDKNGNLKWQTALGGLDWDFGNDLAFAIDGHIIVCGSTYSYGYGGSDGFVAKLNISNGALIWEKFYGGSQDDDFRSIQLTSDGLCSMAGNTNSYGDQNSDFWLYKVNNVGDSIASKVFGNANKAEKCYDFMEDKAGNLVFCGSYDTSFYNSGKNEGYLIKTDLLGNFITEMKYTGAGNNDKFLSVTRTTQNNDYFFSRSVFKPGFEIETQPFFTTNTFIHLNSTTYVGNKDEETNDVINTTDNGFAMVGYTKSFDTVSEDVFFVKLDNTLINASSIVGINVIPPESEEKFFYHNNKIYFNNPDNSTKTYILLNIMGETVYMGAVSCGTIEIPSALSSGIYVIVIDNQIKHKFVKEPD